MDGIIRTPRLTLRALTLEDAEPTSRIMTPAVARWTGSWKGEETPQEIAGRIRLYLDTEERGFGLNRAAVITATGELIGWIGVRRYDERPHLGALGYWIGEPFFGQGYTREAVRALTPVAFDALGVETIEAAAQVANTASLAILRGLGMRHMGRRQEYSTARGASDLCDWFELDRPA